MEPQLQLHITAYTLPSFTCSAGTAAGLDIALGGLGRVGADLASRLKDRMILFFSIVRVPPISYIVCSIWSESLLKLCQRLWQMLSTQSHHELGGRRGY